MVLGFAGSQNLVDGMLSVKSKNEAVKAKAKRVWHMQERAVQAEREAEWARGEAEEARAAQARERREDAQHLRDAEQAAQRAKQSRRDELKRLAKDKAALLERAKVPLLCPACLAPVATQVARWSKQMCNLCLCMAVKLLLPYELL